MNSKIVKSKMVVLTRIEKADVADADVAIGLDDVGWCRLVLEQSWLRGREKADVVW
jgi:hypothetical protein